MPPSPRHRAHCSGTPVNLRVGGDDQHVPARATDTGGVDDERRQVMLFGRRHVKAYRESGGEVGHEWQPGVFTLLLTTTGRTSGEPYTTPLIYGGDGPDYVVVASNGGADAHPDWYRNLEANPEVEIQVEDEVMAGTARTAGAEDRSRLWAIMAVIWPDYDNYATRTDREIPVVVITPQS